MLLVALIANYPGLLYSRHDMGEMQLVATPSDHPIIAHASYISGPEPGCLLTITAAARGPRTEVLVHSQPAALQELRRFAGTDVAISSILPDPALSRVVTLWTSVNCTRDTFKRVVLVTSRRHGAQDIDGRESAWKADHPAICAALTKVDWLDLRRITGATVWNAQVLYRLKLRAFSY
ncbi:hypothetical protein PF007_g14038 [Phytophthora fragariae]|nr:hypothetical protein PF003_g11365 [Phytophthora fragariae]KAE8925072.1 hypothetical protein PF009_g24714 [Phytophthora fragariae]KAE8987879.1 hypothetical protein PF011_g19402 [Phytophthora fragariae]KAE9104499.1 hypothetical protein PF007_g14038 [Phytophthora fragariae]KAE9110391.1 hypothetical protein PF006_g20462 [Phytophthora fragariae]